MARKTRTNRTKKSSTRSTTTVIRRTEKIPRPAPVVDVVTTETELKTEPKVEVRRAATLAQALTEPAVAVVKPETKVVARKVSRKRKVA